MVGVVDVEGGEQLPGLTEMVENCLAELQQVNEFRSALLWLTNTGPLVLCAPSDQLEAGLGALVDYVEYAATPVPANV